MKKSLVFILTAVLAVSLGSVGFTQTKKAAAKPAAAAAKTPAKPAEKVAPAKINNPLIGTWYEPGKEGKTHRIVFGADYLSEQVLMMTDNPGWGTRGGFFSGKYTLAKDAIMFDVVDRNVESETPVVLCKLKVNYTIKNNVLTLKFDPASVKAMQKTVADAKTKAMKAQYGNDYQPSAEGEDEGRPGSKPDFSSMKFVLDTTPWAGKWYSGYGNRYEVTSNGIKMTNRSDDVITLTGKWTNSPVSLSFKDKAGKTQKIVLAYTLSNDRLMLTFKDTASPAYVDIPKNFVTNKGEVGEIQCDKEY